MTTETIRIELIVWHLGVQDGDKAGVVTTKASCAKKRKQNHRQTVKGDKCPERKKV